MSFVHPSWLSLLLILPMILLGAILTTRASNKAWQQLVAAGHQPSGPYRGHKGDIWEGGHRVPLVVRWPGRVEAGSNSDQMVCLTDLFATCAIRG